MSLLLLFNQAGSSKFNQAVAVDSTTSVSLKRSTTNRVVAACVSAVSFHKAIHRRVVVACVSAVEISRRTAKSVKVSCISAASFAKRTAKAIAVACVSRVIVGNGHGTVNFVTVNVVATTSTAIGKMIGKLVSVGAMSFTSILASIMSTLFPSPRVVRATNARTARLQWPTKGTDEVLDYDVIYDDRLSSPPSLPTDSVVSSVWTLVSGDVVLGTRSFSGGRTKVWLSGGTDQTLSTLHNVITTQQGRTMSETVFLFVSDEDPQEEP
jgi:hypothetical protein